MFKETLYKGFKMIIDKWLITFIIIAWLILLVPFAGMIIVSGRFELWQIITVIISVVGTAGFMLFVMIKYHNKEIK
jgi:hypothetical protein